MTSLHLVAADGGAISTVQDTARPLGLSVVGPVMVAGSDARAASFQSTVLPDMQRFVTTNLSETRAVSDPQRFALDPSKLRLQTQSDVRVYFVGEGAGYHNTLGFNTQGVGTQSGNPRLIIPDASSSQSWYNDGTVSSGTRNQNTPVISGDFVNLGSFSAGTLLDFFLIADGANGGRNVYSTTGASVNPDHLNHVVAYARPDSPFLLIGFEDLYNGGDRDYNDLVFALDIGAANVRALISGPAPATWALLAGCLALAWGASRRQRGLTGA